MLGRQRIDTAHPVTARFAGAAISPPTTPMLATMPFCMPTRIGGTSTSQKRSSSSEATTVNTINRITPMSACQLRRIMAQATNSMV